MEDEELILQDQDRTKLDGVVMEMEKNGESEENIGFVVQDFKSKYGKPSVPETNPLKKKEDPESTSTVSDGVSVSQEFEIPPIDPDVAPALKTLYEDYMKSSVLTDEQASDISTTLTDQENGNRGLWETAKAMTKGFFETGLAIPLYNFDNEKDLVEKKAKKNKLEYLEDLSEQDKAQLLDVVGRQANHLDETTSFVLVQNNALEAKSRDIALELEQYSGKTKEELQSLPSEEKDNIRKKYDELKAIQLEYNDNFDVIESDTKDLGTFVEEVNLLKRNYNGLDNFIGRTVNTTKSLIAGGMETAALLNEVNTLGLAPDSVGDTIKEDAEELQAEADKYNELLRPNVSIKDVESVEDFGEWLSDQVATQLPIITTLIATGGTTGSVLLGTSSGGSKAMEMKKENEQGMANYSNTEIFLASAGNGTLEFLGEKVTGGILSKGRRTLKAANEGKLKQGFAKGLKNIMVDSGQEALSEAVTLLGQNAIDRYYLDKKDVELFDGMEDAIAAGGILGGMMTAAPTMVGAGLSKFQSKENNNTIRNNVSKLKNIQDQLDNKDVDPDVKKELESLGKSLMNENKGIYKKDIKNVENKSAEDLKEVSKLNKKIDKEESKAAKIVKNPDIDPVIREDISTRMLKKLEKLKADKDAIMDPKNKSDTKSDTETLPNKKLPTSLQEMFGNKKEDGTLDLKTELKNLDVDQKIIDAISDNVTLEYKDLSTSNNSVTGDTGVGGVYMYNRKSGAQKIVIEKAYKDTPYGRETLIHESVHAATVFALEKLKGNINTKNSDPTISKVDGFSREQIQAAEDLMAIQKQYSDNTSVDKSGLLYGLNNVEEFVAEFIANPEFREHLKRTSPDTKMNMAQAIWNGILKLLGIKPGSAGAKRLLDIESNIDKVLDAQKLIKEKLDKGTTGNSDVQTLPSKKKKSGFDYRKLYAGLPLVTYLDEKIFTNLVAKPVESVVTKAVKKGIESQNKLVRNISEGAISWFNGIGRTDQEIADRRSVEGKQKTAYAKGSQITKQLQELIGFNVESATNVHKVMDPELYDAEDLLTFDGDDATPVSYDNLNDSEKQLHDILREINDMTHEKNYEMGFINDETYEKFKGNYIGRGYEVFEDVLQESKGDFIKNKLGFDIYKQRKDIDQWKIDNKVTDPIYLTVNRMIQTERNMAVKEYADGIAETNIAKDEPQAGYTQLNNRSYGALNGKYVPNYIAEDFKGYFFANSFMDTIYAASQTYDKIALRQFLKKYHTVYSPVVQVGNFVSNHAFAFASGINIAQLWSNLPGARKSLKSKDKDYMTLLENGIIDSNVLTPDLSLTKSAQDKLKLKDEAKGFKKAVGKIQKMDEWAQKTYSGSDDLMKLSAYKSLKNVGYTTDEAVQRVFEGFQNYATVGKIWDLSAKVPVFGNAYIKFQADLMRIVKNAVLKRPMTTAAFLGGLRLATYLASEYGSDESEEERDIREARPFIPKIKLPMVDDIPLVARVGNKEVNLARYISPYYDYDVPNKDWLEKVSGATPFGLMRGDASEMGQSNNLPEAPDVLLGPFVQAFIYNKDFRQKSITDPFATRYKESGLTDREKMFNQFNYAARSVVPLYSTVADAYKVHKYGEDFYGRSKTKEDLLLSKVVKIQTWDDKALKKTVESSLKSIGYKEKEINNKIKAIERNFLNNLVEMDEKAQKGDITQQQFENKVKEMEAAAIKRTNAQLEKLVEQQEKMNELVVKINKLQ